MEVEVVSHWASLLIFLFLIYVFQSLYFIYFSRWNEMKWNEIQNMSSQKSWNEI